jgi:hypothetical protein
LFNRNAHHDQAKGGALTDPNLIRVGWQLEIDCTEVAPPPVVETAPPPTTTIVAPNGGASPSTTRAPGPLVLNAVPQVLVRLGAQAASPPAGVAASIDLGPADGTSTSVSPLIKGGRPLMVGGVDGPTFEVTHGADLLPEFMGFDDQPPALTLIDGRGESLTLPTAKGGLAMVHVDLGLPQGDYRLEASDGTHRGSIGLRVEDSDGLEIRLQTIDQAHMQLEVVAAQGPLATDWYHLTERGGRKVADYWASGTLVPQQGVGRVEVRRDGADAGAYCSPQVNGFNACRYDGYLLAPAKT